MLLLQAPFDSQPQEVVEIDWGNPLASGLVHCTLGNNLTNLAGPPLTPTFGTTGLTGWGGPTPGIVFNDSVVQGDICPAFQGVFTTGLCLHTPSSLNSGRLVMGAFTNADSSNCRFEISTTFLSAGYRNALNESAVSTGIITPQVGQTYMHGGRWTDSAVELWVDGRLIATNTATGNGQNRNRVSMGGDLSYGGFAYFGTIHLSLWWNRALSDDELRSVSANPWQLFRALADVWVPTLADYKFTDDFNRSDGALGSNWANVSGFVPFDISSNVARFSSTATPFVLSVVNPSTATFSADHEVTATLASTSAFDKIGPAVRVDTSAGTGYAVDMNVATGGALMRFTPATRTNLGFGGFPVAVGDTVKLRVAGSTLSCFVNGRLVSSGTDATHTSGQPGMWGLWENVRGTTLDNFFAFDLGVAGSVFSQTISGAASFVGAIAAVAQRTLAGSQSFAGTSTSSITRTLTGAMSFVGDLARGFLLALSSGASFAGALVSQVVLLRAVDGAASFVGVISSAVQRPLGAAASFAGALVREVRATTAGVLGFAGALATQLVGGLAFVANATVSFSGTAAVQLALGRTVDGAASFAGAITRNIALTGLLAGIVATQGTLSTLSQFARTVQGVLDATGVLTVVRTVLNTLTLSSDLSFTKQLERFKRRLRFRSIFPGADPHRRYPSR